MSSGPHPSARDEAVARTVRTALGAREARPAERVARLWSGYGEIRRFRLVGANVPSVMVKRVAPPAEPEHRRGWATDHSHARKLRSYGVEQAFYERFSFRCRADSRVPRAHLVHHQDERWLFVLEDLDAAGFAGRRELLSDAELKACLDWLAHFHARFLGVAPEGLWDEGTYWHLATRPDELAVMQDADLREAAPALDGKLREARFRTLVHGDAKVANFCFGSGTRVAAVDFQYVGGGVGVKDVAYLFSSCLGSSECEARAEGLLDHYFVTLRSALHRLHPDLDAGALEAEWRALYPVAWADFTRFLLGWAPQHAKLHGYSLGLSRRALRAL